MCAVLLKPHNAHAQSRGAGRLLKTGFGYFNRGFEWLSVNYGKLTARFVRATAVIGVIYLGPDRPHRFPDVAATDRLYSGSRHRLSGGCRGATSRIQPATY